MRIDLNGIFGLPLDAETVTATPPIEPGAFEQAMLNASLLMPTQTLKLNTRGEANFNFQPNAEQETPDLFEEILESDQELIAEEEATPLPVAAFVPVFTPLPVDTVSASPNELGSVVIPEVTPEASYSPLTFSSEVSFSGSAGPEFRYEAAPTAPVFTLPIASEQSFDVATTDAAAKITAAPISFVPAPAALGAPAEKPVSTGSTPSTAASPDMPVQPTAQNPAKGQPNTLDPILVRELKPVIVSPVAVTNAPQFVAPVTIQNAAVFAVQEPKPAKISPIMDATGTAQPSRTVAAPVEFIAVSGLAMEPVKVAAVSAQPQSDSVPVTFAPAVSEAKPQAAGFQTTQTKPAPESPNFEFSVPVVGEKETPVSQIAVATTEIATEPETETELAPVTEKSEPIAEIELREQPIRAQAVVKTTEEPTEEVARRGVEQIIARVDRLQELRPPGNIVIRMSPEDLGTVTLSIRAGSVQPEARISASHEQMFHALQTHKQELSAVVEAKGVTLSGFDFNNQGGRQQSDPAHNTFSEAQRDHNFAAALTDNPVQSAPQWATDILDLRS